MKMSKNNCARKKRYLSEQAAFVAISTRMRHRYKKDDWICFRTYLCSKCKGWHLTKEIS